MKHSKPQDPHSNLDIKNKEDQCPFLNNKNKQNEEREKKEKKQYGGCPIMKSEKKKNPGLNVNIIPSYGVNYISSTGSLIQSSQQTKGNEKKLHEYSQYLINTIYHTDDDQIMKIRKLELLQRMHIFDKLKEEGNKLLYKGDLVNSIRMYEKALSILKWLEVKEKEEKEREWSEDKEERETQMHYEKEQKEFMRRYETFNLEISRENTVLKDGEKEEKEENMMRQSLLVQLYLNMSVAYMRSSAFSLASLALQDAQSLKPISAIISFRQAQSIAYNLNSNEQQLQQAAQLVQQALSMRTHETVFQASAVILDMLGYNNSQSIFEQLLKLIENRRRTLKKEKEEIRREIKEVLDRKGKGKEGIIELSWGEDDQWEEYNVMQLMVSKYYQMIQLYMDSNKLDAVQQAYISLQNLKQVLYIADQYYFLDLSAFHQNQSIQIDHIRVQKVKQLFDNAQFEWDLLQLAIDEYFKEEKQKNNDNKSIKESQESQESQERVNVKKSYNDMIGDNLSVQIVLVMIYVLGAAVFMNYFGRIYK